MYRLQYYLHVQYHIVEVEKKKKMIVSPDMMKMMMMMNSNRDHQIHNFETSQHWPVLNPISNARFNSDSMKAGTRA